MFERLMLPKKIEVGQVWKEANTGRYIKILQEEVHGTGPAWAYCNEKGVNWHYCDLWDFAVWKRFEYVGNP